MASRIGTSEELDSPPRGSAPNASEGKEMSRADPPFRGRSAGLLIIGNEVLSGKVADENGPFLLGRLRSLGVEVRRLCTVSDDLDEIVWGVRQLKQRCDWIITTGGVGPTHDDVTVAAVAAALARPVVRAPELEALIRSYLGDSPPPEAFRMADVVEGAELLYAEGTRLPAIVVERVALLPGVPALMRRQFEVLAPRLETDPFVLRQVFLDVGEPAIASLLGRIARSHPGVAIGSYPRFDREADHRVKLTLEARDPAAVEAALDALLAALPRASVLRTA
jgi:molybdenum cofactor synthesis domain-containing protein